MAETVPALALTDDPGLASRHASQIEASQRIMARELLRQGNHLAMAKAKLSPAAFNRFLFDAGLHGPSGELLTRVALLFTPSDAVDLFHPGAMLVLAAAEVPQAAVNDALALAQRGAVITIDRARELVAHHLPAQPSA